MRADEGMRAYARRYASGLEMSDAAPARRSVRQSRRYASVRRARLYMPIFVTRPCRLMRPMPPRASATLFRDQAAIYARCRRTPVQEDKRRDVDF